MMMIALIPQFDGIKDVLGWAIGLLASLGILDGFKVIVVVLVVGTILYQVVGKR